MKRLSGMKTIQTGAALAAFLSLNLQAQVDHSAHQTPVNTPPASPTAPATIDPAGTLRPDVFDTPASPSVAEAARATSKGTGHEGHAATADADRSAPVLYVCPMHPEVTSEKPDDCPKCGMALVRKE